MTAAAGVCGRLQRVNLWDQALEKLLQLPEDQRSKQWKGNIESVSSA